MKRFLIVLFGVLVFQGSVIAAPVECWKVAAVDTPPRVIAKILHPSLPDVVIRKDSPFLLQWKDMSGVDALRSVVDIRLYRKQGKGKDLFGNRLNGKPNNGVFLITKQDFKRVKVKADQEYFFEVELKYPFQSGQDKTIQSVCFTFNMKRKEKEPVICDDGKGTKVCLNALIANVRLLMDQVGDLQRQLQDDDSSDGGADGATVVNLDSKHTHNFSEIDHSHKYASSSHNHDDVASHKHDDLVSIDSLSEEVNSLEERIDTFGGGSCGLHMGKEAKKDCCEGKWPAGTTWRTCEGYRWNPINGSMYNMRYDLAYNLTAMEMGRDSSSFETIEEKNPVCWSAQDWARMTWEGTGDVGNPLNPWVVGQGAPPDLNGDYDEKKRARYFCAAKDTCYTNNWNYHDHERTGGLNERLEDEEVEKFLGVRVKYVYRFKEFAHCSGTNRCNSDNDYCM